MSRASNAGLDAVDPTTVIRRTSSAIEGAVTEAEADGAVTVLTGTVPSAVLTTLAVMALGPSRVGGLVLPWTATGEGTVERSRTLADELGIRTRTVDLRPVVSGLLLRSVPDRRRVAVDRLSSRSRYVTDHDGARRGYGAATERLVEQLRSAVALFEARTSNRLVLDATTRTEAILGEGLAVRDPRLISPLDEHYRSTVADVAIALGLPARVTGGPVDAAVDEDEPGDELLDAIVTAYLDRGASVEAIAGSLDVDPGLVRRCITGIEHRPGGPPADRAVDASD